MKAHHLRIARFTAGILLSLTVSIQAAEDWIRYTAQPAGSKVKIEGTSTLHAWTMEGLIIGGYVELDPGFEAAPKPGKVVARAQVAIPVRSIKSGKSEMDNVMQQAMKQDVHPKIEYRLTEMSLKEAPKSPGGPFQFDTKGELTVAGVTNKISMLVGMERIDKTKLKFSSSAPLKMTDFGVTPPVKFGVFRTGDDIKIAFEWITVQRAETAK
jgi:YceI-like protein